MGGTCAQASAINVDGCCHGQHCQSEPIVLNGEHEVDETCAWNCGAATHGAVVIADPPTGMSKHGARRVAVAVMRHGERLDSASPKEWKTHEDSKRYPFDPPLTNRGKHQVGGVVRDIDESCHGIRFSMVVSSPFIRCVETAIEACSALKLPLCIDRSLSEIFCEGCIGRCDPKGPTLRSEEEILSRVPPDLRRTCSIIGSSPSWPESLQEGRMRIIRGVEKYASRGVRLGGDSFFLVTHGDGVAASLVVALAGANGQGSPALRNVHVQYCGYVVLERETHRKDPDVGLMDPKGCWHVRHGNIQIGGAPTCSTELAETSSKQRPAEQPTISRAC